MPKHGDKGKSGAQGPGRRKPPQLSRRALIKGTAVSMPMILTLQSGAALARSSNLIGPSSPSSTDALGRTLCLDTDYTVSAFADGDVQDLGEPPLGYVSAINDRVYKSEANNGSATVSTYEICETGQTVYYQQSGWQDMTVSKGIIVSATALSSFADHIIITDF